MTMLLEICSFFVKVQKLITTVFHFTAGLCNGALGLQKSRIKNRQITASSTWPGLYTWRARLHHAQAWCARYNNHNQWLKFDFLRPTKVTGIALQGRSNVHQWITRFLVYSSQDNVHWALYRYKNNDKVRSSHSHLEKRKNGKKKLNIFFRTNFFELFWRVGQKYALIVFTINFCSRC